MSTPSETHSIQSLSARLGVSRAAALSAIASGKLPILEQSTAGTRRIFKITSEAILGFKMALVADLERRLSKMTAPHELPSATSSALAAMRSESDAGAEIITPMTLSERLKCGLELATWLLERHAERVADGYRVTRAAMSEILANRDRLNKSKPRRNSGI
jgi:hypothetical protein